MSDRNRSSARWTRAQRERAKREGKTLFTISFNSQYVKPPTKGAGDFIEYSGQCGEDSAKEIGDFIVKLLKKHKAEEKAEKT